ERQKDDEGEPIVAGEGRGQQGERAQERRRQDAEAHEVEAQVRRPCGEDTVYLSRRLLEDLQVRRLRLTHGQGRPFPLLSRASVSTPPGPPAATIVEESLPG